MQFALAVVVQVGQYQYLALVQVVQVLVVILLAGHLLQTQ
jgi:hypothetical protein